tara:strand:- start:163 stop:1293 length:1131 start_codon:yes stop_codon:yes gene_type:complete
MEENKNETPEQPKFTVKEVTGEEKSRAEVEEQLLAKHEEKFADNKPKEEEVEKVEEVKEEAPASEINDADVLKYIKNRYDKDIDSVEKLFDQKNSNEDLPEDVSAYFKYKKETGRGIEDFVKLQRNYDDMDGDQVLRAYYNSTEEGLDGDDITDIMDDKFSFDEDLDDPKDIKKKQLAKKRELVKAKKFLNEQRDKYKAPLESSGGGLSSEDKEKFDSYKSYIEESTNAQEAQQRRYDYFLNKTSEVFNDEFKGFEFNIGEKQFTFKPGDSGELKSKQSDVNNFTKKFMDEKTGMISDAKGYHRAMSVAMNLDKFAEFFYNQGVTSTVDEVSKKSKNINMEMRKTPTSLSKDGLKIRAVGDTSSGRGLKIRSIKKS